MFMRKGVSLCVRWNIMVSLAFDTEILSLMAVGVVSAFW